MLGGDHSTYAFVDIKFILKQGGGPLRTGGIRRIMQAYRRFTREMAGAQEAITYEIKADVLVKPY